MHDDRIRWDRRYQHALDESADRAVVTPTPPDVVELFAGTVDRFPTVGRVVDIACGTGAVALWLGGRGLHVVGLDVSPVAIGILSNTATRCGLDEQVDARVVDLDHGLPSDLDDLDMIVCQRFRQPSLYPVMLDRLRPSGLACITVLSEVGVADPGPFHAPHGELLDAFTGDACIVLEHTEGNGLASIVVQRN